MSENKDSKSDSNFIINATEKEISQLWYSSELFCFDKNNNIDEVFVVDTPPPTVSGVLHMGHVFSYCHTDLVARWQRMYGKNVFYPIGFDDNGLPTERLVEKLHKIRAIDMYRKKKEEEFHNLYNATVEKSEREFELLFKNLGLSFDWSQKYQTISEKSHMIAYMSFADLWYKGLIYTAQEPIYWDVLDQTALAQADIVDTEMDGTACTLKFDLKRITFELSNKPSDLAEVQEQDITSLGTVEIMTTRPELLPSCFAVLFNPNDERYNGKALGEKRTIMRTDEKIVEIECIDLMNKENCVNMAVTPFGKCVFLFPDSEVQQDKGTGLVMACCYGDMQDSVWYKRHAMADLQERGGTGYLSFIQNSIGGGKFEESVSNIDIDFAQDQTSDHELDENNFARKLDRLVGNIIRQDGIVPKFYYSKLYNDFKLFQEEINGKCSTKDSFFNVNQAREYVLNLLSQKDSITSLSKIRHAVKCAERSGKPVEVIETRQFYIDFGLSRNVKNKVCYQESIKKSSNIQTEFLKMSKLLHFYPENMHHRLDQWILGLNQNWCISRNRFAGIKIPSVNSCLLLESSQEQKEMKTKTDNKHKISSIKLNESSLHSVHSKSEHVESYTSHILRGTMFDMQFENLSKLLHYDSILEPYDSSTEQKNTDDLKSTKDDALVFDTWFTSSVSPQLSTGIVSFDIRIMNAFDVQPRDFELHKALFPFDLRPQAHEIIRTWTFYTLAKAYVHALQYDGDEWFIPTKAYFDAIKYDYSLKQWYLDDNGKRITTNDNDIKAFIKKCKPQNEKEETIALNNALPWKNVMLSGWCLARDRTKMSKSKGNVVEPLPLIEKYGTDVVRYWTSTSHLGVDTPYNEETLREGKRCINKIKNVVSLFLLHKPKLLGNPTSIADDIKANNIWCSLDKWILSRFADTLLKYNTFFAAYDYCRAREVVERFFWDDVCDNYLEIAKGRLYGVEGQVFQDILNNDHVLEEVIVDFELYQKLNFSLDQISQDNVHNENFMQEKSDNLKSSEFVFSVRDSDVIRDESQFDTKEQKAKKLQHFVQTGQQSAIYTLHHVVKGILIMFAPFMPFETEKLYSSAFINSDLINNDEVKSNDECKNGNYIETNSIHRKGILHSIISTWEDEKSILSGIDILDILSVVRKRKAELKLSVKSPVNKIVLRHLPVGCNFDLRSVCNIIDGSIDLSAQETALSESKIVVNVDL